MGLNKKILLVFLVIIVLSLIAYAASTVTDGEFTLNIYDSTDSETRIVGDSVIFYAGYSDGELGDYSDCKIKINVNGTYGPEYDMTYDVYSGMYKYYRIFNQ